MAQAIGPVGAGYTSVMSTDLGDMKALLSHPADEAIDRPSVGVVQPSIVVLCVDAPLIVVVRDVVWIVGFC